MIEGSRAEELLDVLGDLPDDDQARANKFRQLGATCYPRVSNHSLNINEDGSSKQDVSIARNVQ